MDADVEDELSSSDEGSDCEDNGGKSSEDSSQETKQEVGENAAEKESNEKSPQEIISEEKIGEEVQKVAVNV